jgi:hypothetical protein
MARVLVIHYTDKGRLPLRQLNKDELLKKAGEWLKANADVKFNGSFANSDGVGICDWEAPSTDKVKEAIEALGVPYDAIVAVNQVLP